MCLPWLTSRHPASRISGHMPVINCRPFSAVSALITAPLPSSTSPPPAARTVVPSRPEAGLRGLQDWVTKVTAASHALWGSSHHATCPCEDTGAAPRGGPAQFSCQAAGPRDANARLPRNGVGEGGKMVPPAHKTSLGPGRLPQRSLLQEVSGTSAAT